MNTHEHKHEHRIPLTGVAWALGSALLFGASTPFAKVLLGDVHPVLLAALLYLGSGIGLLALRRLRGSDPSTSLARTDMPWFAGAILAGGVAGPLLLMLGLARTPASSAALLLNLEGVATAALAWLVFRENADRRIVLGMACIVAGGALLSWQGADGGLPWGALGIVGACLCWAIDNNLTRKVAGSDAFQVAGWKGLVAGAVNLALGLALGYALPGTTTIAAAAVLGFFGYGASLVMFVLALRHLGSARTGAYFSAAPFAGAAIALPLLGERPGAYFWLALLLMAIGLWLHLTERHAHEHAHDQQEHSHAHSHDEHHRHAHDFAWDGKEPHVHRHAHAPMKHSHAHTPDLHHRHDH